MKNSLSFLLSLVLLGLGASALQAQNDDFRKHPPKPGPAPIIQLGDYEQFQLDNGLTVIVVENHKIPRVSFQVFVDVPPHVEGDKAGTAELAGQLLKMGTTNRTKTEIDEVVDFIGAHLSTSATGIFASSLTKHKDVLLDIIADVLFHPTFPQDQLEKLKKQTISSLIQAEQDPNAIADNVGRVLRYGKNHPYGELTTQQTVERISVADCRQYYETYFKPNISYLIAVGDITPEEVRAIAKQYFSGWKKGSVPQQKVPAPELLPEARVAFVHRNGAVQSVINITHPVYLQPGHPDAIAASLANSLLGGFFGSRLNQNLREGHGYTYGARASLHPDRYVGSFRAYASVRNEVTDSAMTEFLNELRRIREEPISEEELELVKSVTMGRFARSLEQPQTIARFALNTARYQLPEDYYKNYLKQVESVTTQTLQRAARKYILPDRAWRLVVGNKDEVAEKLVSFAPDGEVHYYDAWGNPVVEGASVPDDMDAATVLSRFLKAVGADQRMDQLKVVRIVMTAQGNMSMEMEQIIDTKGRYANKVSVNGNVMQEQIFDGEKGVTKAMGQVIPMKEEEIAMLKEPSKLHPFKEAVWLKQDYALELDGIERVNGKSCYVVRVKLPDGRTVRAYYDVDSGLKVREVEPISGQQVVVTTDLDDYRAVEGFYFPFKWTLSGVMPVPMVMTVEKFELNPDVDSNTFKVK